MAAQPPPPAHVEARFRNAVSVIQSLPKEGPYQPSNEMKLKFYALYKQATIGPCNTPKPGFWDYVGRAKWEAWNFCGNMSTEEAMTKYVDELRKIVESMPQSPEVAKFMDGLKLEDEEGGEATEGGGAKEGDEEASSQPEAPEDERPAEEEEFYDSFEVGEDHEFEHVDPLTDRRPAPANEMPVVQSADRHVAGSAVIVSLQEALSRIHGNLLLILQRLNGLEEAVKSQQRQRSEGRRGSGVLHIPWSSFLLLVVWPFVCIFVTKIIRRLLLKN